MSAAALPASGRPGTWKRFPKASITVLERDPVPMGASTRNAGFACFGSPGELAADARSLGTGPMLELVELRYRGLRLIEKTFPARKIDLDWCGGYELFGEGDLTAGTLKDQLEYLNVLLRPVTGSRRTFRDASERIDAYGFGDTALLVRNKDEGALHSGRLARLLQKGLQRSGVQLLHGVAATDLLHTGDGFDVATSSSYTIRAKRVVLCNNTAAPALARSLQVTPARGQVLVTSPVAGLRWSGTFHADEGYYYFRNLGNRVLLGGARNKAFEAEATDERVTTPLIQEELERFLDRVVLPGHRGSYKIEHRWSGIMGMGAGKAPVVSDLGGGLYAAVALGGIGVAAAPEVGRRLAKLVAW